MTPTTTMHRPGHPDDAPAALYLALLLLTVAVLGLFASASSGCSTVTPPPAPAAQVASFDQGDATSGILRYDSRAAGYIVTARFVQRYEALVAVYGDAKDSLTGLPYFLPALTRGYGLRLSETGEYVMTAEAMTYFVRMNQWRRSGRAPR